MPGGGSGVVKKMMTETCKRTCNWGRTAEAERLATKKSPHYFRVRGGKVFLYALVPNRSALLHPSLLLLFSKTLTLCEGCTQAHFMTFFILWVVLAAFRVVNGRIEISA